MIEEDQASDLERAMENPIKEDPRAGMEDLSHALGTTKATKDVSYVVKRATGRDSALIGDLSNLRTQPT